MEHDRELIEGDIEAYLEQHQNKELLRFTSVGSVDDGKSTMIGRLLHDTHGLYEDQLASVKRASSKKGQEEMDLALFTDGLKAEREQGITIDVAYRYFSTAKRKFIIADTPGHVQYTRNMATGASTANVAIILIDARYGVLQQSKRHAYIARLLGIPHLVVCVNKMDLEAYSKMVFEKIKGDFQAVAERLGFKDVSFIPISALVGDNVAHLGNNMPWYRGGTLLEYLETVPIAGDRNLDNLRYPVQYVLRPHLDYRGFSGEVASGVLRKGDRVVALPSRRKSRVKAIDTYDGEIDEAFAPMSVTVRLDDEIDISRGDMIVREGDEPHVGRSFEAMMVWMNERPADQQKSYLLKHSTQMVRAEITSIEHVIDLETLDQHAAGGLVLNDIARVRVRCHRPIYFDAYEKNRTTGAFVLIDSITNNTVAAGMIREPERGDAEQEDAELGARSQVSPVERQRRLGQRGATVWLTGLPASGKTEIAYALERRLYDLGRVAMVVDPADSLGEGDELGGVTPDYAAQIARRNSDAGLITIFAFASPKRSDRQRLRERHAEDRFVEVYVATPRDACEARDPSAAYERSTIDYEAPEDPAVTVSMADTDSETAAEEIVQILEARGVFDEG